MGWQRPFGQRRQALRHLSAGFSRQAPFAGQIVPPGIGRDRQHCAQQHHCTWRYAAPYDCYDMTSADPAFLADPGNGFFALVDDTGLIGFRSFGPDGQVPGGEYDDSALDTGGGLWPELTGQGKGRAAIFEDYRLRIAGVIRDYGMTDREQAPKDSLAVHGAH